MVGLTRFLKRNHKGDFLRAHVPLDGCFHGCPDKVGRELPSMRAEVSPRWSPLHLQKLRKIEEK